MCRYGCVSEGYSDITTSLLRKHLLNIVFLSTHSFFHSFTHSLAHSLTHSLTHSLMHSLTHLLTHSLIHSFTHSPTHPLSLTPSLLFSDVLQWNILDVGVAAFLLNPDNISPSYSQLLTSYKLTLTPNSSTQLPTKVLHASILYSRPYSDHY